MHIVLFNHYAGSPKMGMEYRPYYLAQEWIKNGHKVTIVAATYSHIRTKNKTIKENFLFENIDGIDYIWIRTTEYKDNGLRRILSMLQYVGGLYRLIPELKEEKIDVVVASSTYPLDNYPAKRLARKTGAKYVYEVHDLWPLSPRLLGGYSQYHPFIVVMQMAENFAYKHVDKVVSMAPCAEGYMREHGLEAGKFSYVPNGIYLPEVSEPEPLCAELKEKIPEGKMIVGYCGTFGVANALHNLIDTANLLRNSCPEVFFAVVGSGPEQNNLQRRIDSYGLTNIRLFPSISKRQVQSFLSLCDLTIITWNDSSLYQYGISPNKIFDYMYAGRPIVQSVNAANDILQDAGCGYTCDTNPEAIKSALIRICALSENERQKMGQNGRAYVLRHHTYDVLARQFINIIES